MKENIVAKYYNSDAEREWKRMDRHPIEFEVTKKHLNNYLEGVEKIADIGGGPGRYSFNYAQKGYEVSLVDLSSENISLAKNKSKEMNIELKEMHVGTSTDLSFLESESFNLVLCFGPLYHLENEEDRTKTINECKRILKENGILATMFLTPWSHTISTLKNDPKEIIRIREAFDSMLTCNKNMSGIDIGFPHGWYPNPSNIKEYMETYNIKTERIVATEGYLGRFVENCLDKLSEKELNEYIEYCFKLSTEPSLLGACEHILYLGRKMV